MKKFFSVVAAVVLPVAVVCAQEDAKDPTAEIREGARQVYEAINARDVAKTLSLAHPVMYKLTKGKENYEKLTQASMDELTKHDSTFTEIEIGMPTAAVKAGADLVSFIPTSMVISMDGQRVRAKGFLVAIFSPGQTKWLYFDGAGIAQHAELIQMLLPGLPPGTQFPPVSKEPVL